MWQNLRTNLRLSWRPNLMAALPAAVLTTVLSAWSIDGVGHYGVYAGLLLGHFLCAYLLLELLWLPLTWCRKQLLYPRYAALLALVLTVLLTAILCLIFPHELFRRLLVTRTSPLTVLTGVALFHAAIVYVFVRNLRNLRLDTAAVLPGRRRYRLLKRALHRLQHNPQLRRALSEMPLRSHLLLPRVLLGAVSFFIGLYLVVLFEWWAVNLVFAIGQAAHAGDLTPAELCRRWLNWDSGNPLSLPALLQPYRFPNLPERVAQGEIAGLIGERLPLISITLAGAFLLFLNGIMPLRLMSLILPPVWHNDALYCRRLLSVPDYASQFYLAVLAQNPLFTIAGLLVWLFLIAMPLIVDLVGKPLLLQAMVGADQILFAFTLLAAWVSPLVYAGVYVDRTYTTYFNTKLANLILDMRGHLVIFGYGHLGQRVVDRELLKIRRQAAGDRRTRFEKIITPELDLEELCPAFMIVDRDLSKLLFSAQNDFLGNFGVVAALEERYATAAVPGSRLLSHRRRILVPIVQGDVTEPFTMSRVNFERAGFLISTVSQEERIREVFDRATAAGLRAIICVSRSDQMVNLTYKATRFPLTFVYPKQDTGVALGQRLLAAVLKVLPHLPAGRTPRILVVGRNKANHYMLETLWHAWPGADLTKKAAVFSEMLRFIVTGSESVDPLPRLAQDTGEPDRAAFIPAPGGRQTSFNWWWRCNYLTGTRYHTPPDTQRPLYFPVPTCLQSNESGILEHCLHEFQPDIVVINDDEIDKSHMYFLKLLNSLERFKFGHANYRLPLILMGGAHGDDTARKDIGDAFQLYDALARLYREPPAPGHPRYAYFRRQPPRRLLGDSAQDALADTEEIISGIRDNWELAAEVPVSMLANRHAGVQPSWGESIELNACLPNLPIALPDLCSRLAGLRCTATAEAPLRKILPAGSTTISRPVFHYLRHLKLAVAGRGFGLSGYADLHTSTLAELQQEQEQGSLFATRAYASDGHDYRTETAASAEWANLPVPRLLQLATGNPQPQLATKTFLELLLGDETGDTAGPNFCPGMTNCPIASYQHYIVASNRSALADWRERGQNHVLQHAPHYSCASGPGSRPAPPPYAQDLPRYARIFCCCHAKRNDPGLIALVLNLLNFRQFAGLLNRHRAESAAAQEWLLNLEYFKNMTCHNRRFGLCRVFGVRRYLQDLLHDNHWSLAEYEHRLHRILPLSLLQIMPVGSPENAAAWFDYSVALYRLLWVIAPGRFRLDWWDQTQRRWQRHSLHPETGEYPIVIQISNRQHRTRRQLREQGCCEYCRVADPQLELGCAAQRPWLAE
ncbi:MAG: hypothetical protein ONB48_06480 [candidate division KSB1 bacterium]|nr:hypothetical protein [candidate division KSB1 bacterium]MDZ7273187.1 hypothetical protein [candidate division KSB1 bacterium]MDZ7285289.1 hypothetical protein [candidate division KSB1 bacterium]MDZ7298321.1 hypothetical protein [candidate division KSB1 bacterium]MDZ7307396.1 hypothetical protein [candidate division KSB1 bacterium]